MKRRWLIISGIAAVVVAIVAVFVVRSRAPEGPRYETAEVRKGPLAAKVTATGTLSALVTVQVGSQVSGRLQEILVDYNSPVKKGQLIARIDSQLFNAALEQARANNAAARGNLAKAKVDVEQNRRQFERQKALADKQLISASDLDTAQAGYDSARAAVDAAYGTVQQTEASLHQAEINLAYTNIVSPINGTVISRNVDVGQTVAATLQAPVLFTIAEDLTRMQVDTNVAEADVGKLQPAQEASFTVDAFPQTPFVGRIRQIRNAPITVQNVVTYDAVIDVENPELKLRPGMTANVTVVFARADDVLKVPNAALRWRPSSGNGGTFRPGFGNPLMGGPPPPAGTALAAGPRRSGKAPLAPGEKEIYVLRDGEPVAVRVMPGISDGSTTEIVRGDLKEGDRVITDTASPGQSGAPRGGPRMF